MGITAITIIVSGIKYYQCVLQNKSSDFDVIILQIALISLNNPVIAVESLLFIYKS